MNIFVTDNFKIMTGQCFINLPAYSRGFHLITRQITSALPPLPQTGILQLFIRHTSAALTLNENADPDVRTDFETFFDKFVPDSAPFFEHTLEGADDMPAHIKSSMLGQSLTIPIVEGRLGLGTWQGIYLCEFRNQGGSRQLIATWIS
jgi:secondary thiamine-phosphate synthase enzyme